MNPTSRGPQAGDADAGRPAPPKGDHVLPVRELNPSRSISTLQREYVWSKGGW